MKSILVTYTYYGHKISQTVPIVDIISQMPDAVKVETVLDVISTISGNERLDDFQKAIFKEKVRTINALLKNQLTDDYGNNT